MYLGIVYRVLRYYANPVIFIFFTSQTNIYINGQQTTHLFTTQTFYQLLPRDKCQKLLWSTITPQTKSKTRK